MDVIGFFGLDRDGNGFVIFFVDCVELKKAWVLTVMFYLLWSDCVIN